MTVFQTDAAGWEPIATKISNSTVTDIVDGTDFAWNIAWLSVGVTTTGTPAITVELYDIATAVSTYLVGASICWNAATATARQGIRFEDIVVAKGSKLRVKSGDGSGLLDVTGIKTRVGGAT